jgi:hypothetical protein
MAGSAGLSFEAEKELERLLALARVASRNPYPRGGRVKITPVLRTRARALSRETWEGSGVVFRGVAQGTAAEAAGYSGAHKRGERGRGGSGAVHVEVPGWAGGPA